MTNTTKELHCPKKQISWHLIFIQGINYIFALITNEILNNYGNYTEHLSDT